MKILAFDPGATRMGWACLEEHRGELIYHASGIIGLDKGEMKDQEYKISLIEHLIDPIEELLSYHKPDLVVNEIVPSVGSGNFAVAGQGYLANAAIVVVNCMSLLAEVEVKQIAARTVQTKIARRPEKKTKSITKVQVRNGVVDILPDLKDRAKGMVADESDAIAIGLAWLGTHYPELLDGKD